MAAKRLKVAKAALRIFFKFLDGDMIEKLQFTCRDWYF